MGMNSEEYWRGDPYLAVIYRRAQHLKNEQKNGDAWWQGLYIYDAVSTIAHNILKKKGQKEKTYPKEPYPLGGTEKSQRDMKAAKEREKAVNYFNDLKGRMEKKYGRK